MAATWRIRCPFLALRTALFLVVAIPNSGESRIFADAIRAGKNLSAANLKTAALAIRHFASK
ncbi:hypothetical protein [Mesorhizobium sp. WSM3224]|uniref:hypothetical protein n=1 Tax=Mesorhizobium sp. WSM3224 TaxID=1040986 RepID=UPI0018DDD0E8|nr:hypothetical protein [Mesorhizobium sp. WSM3224]